jgi:hypothetical protein
VPQPESSIWCPANSELPLKCNRLNLIGEVKTMLRREGDVFSVVAPDSASSGGITFVPLAHEGGYVWLDSTPVFRELGSVHYLCLTDTIVSIP